MNMDYRWAWGVVMLLGGAVLSGAALGGENSPTAQVKEELPPKVAAMPQQWHQHGEPSALADLAPPDVPDDQNAAIPLEQAIYELDQQSAGPRSGNDEFPTAPPYPARWYELVKENHEENMLALLKVRQARSLPKIAWYPGIRDASDKSMTEAFRGLNEARGLANSLADEALYRHVQGNDAEAMEVLADLDFLSKAMGQRPLLLSMLVAWGIDALRTEDALVISTTLNAPGTAHPAQRQVVNDAIASLLKDDLVPHAQRALREERVLFVARLQTGEDAGVSRGRMADVLELFTRSADELGEMVSPVKQPATRMTDAATQKELANDPEMQIMEGVIKNLVKQIRRITLERQVAAIGLAMALYRQDHSGKWPAQLQELVPQYLPSVPVDPYSHTGAALRYKILADGKRPVVGSVGLDGQWGSTKDIPSQAMYAPRYSGDNGSDDQWRDLSLWKE